MYLQGHLILARNIERNEKFFLVFNGASAILFHTLSFSEVHLLGLLFCVSICLQYLYFTFKFLKIYFYLKGGGEQ